jgi:hypothetical protein
VSKGEEQGQGRGERGRAYQEGGESGWIYEFQDLFTKNFKITPKTMVLKTMVLKTMILKTMILKTIVLRIDCWRIQKNPELVLKTMAFGSVYKGPHKL